MASSSSEEDEEERKIMAEIADCAAKDLTKAQLESKGEREHKNSAPKRTKKDYDDQEAQSSHLTPECKRHIAKKLSSYLDGCIQVETGYTFKPKEIKSRVSGIHLFCSSRNKLLDVENDYLKEKKPKTPKRLQHSYSSSESSDNEDELAKFQEAAVCGQLIIDQSCPSTDKYGMHREDSNKKKKKKKKKEKEQNKDKNKNNVSEYEFDHLKDRWKEKCYN